MNFEDVKKDMEISEYINQANYVMNGTGYTEHGLAHATKCVHNVEAILKAYGASERDVELGKIAAYLHDIGNTVNRVNHAQSGAIMAFTLLKERGMQAREVSKIVTAIGNHDEQTANPVNPIAAALIIADKSDVRRSRCQAKETDSFDIHDKVNYAATSSSVEVHASTKTITLCITLDSAIAGVLDYCKIYTGRMDLCQRAAEFLGFKFILKINDTELC